MCILHTSAMPVVTQGNVRVPVCPGAAPESVLSRTLSGDEGGVASEVASAVLLAPRCAAAGEDSPMLRADSACDTRAPAPQSTTLLRSSDHDTAARFRLGRPLPAPRAVSVLRSVCCIVSGCTPRSTSAPETHACVVPNHCS